MRRHTFTRLKDDAYDRLWRIDPQYNDSGWYPLKKQLDIEDDGGGYKLPAEALKTAAQSLDVSSSLEFDENDVFEDQLDLPYEYYVYFHFAEIEQLPDGKNRIITITLNGKLVLDQPLVLEYSKPVTVEAKTLGRVVFSITATWQSYAPPILNAFEVYKLVQDLNSPTHPQDASGILDIKNAYQITRNWQVDPCLPTEYAWEGLVCSSATPPRIESL